MKSIPTQDWSRVLVCMALLATVWMPLQAQETPEAPEVPANLGFIRFVNAIGLPGRLKVRVDGTEASPDGFPQGEVTGSIGLLPKTYQMELEHESLGKETVQVPVQTGQIFTVIAFKTEKPKDPKAKPSPKGDSKKPGPRLACHLEQSVVSPPGLKDPTLTLLQLTTADSIAFKVSGTSAPARSETPVRVPITRAMGAFPEVHLQGKAVCLLNFDAPADQLVVFFSGDDGNLKYAPMRNDVR